MRKFFFVLPACAILLATTVLVSELGASLNAQTPNPATDPTTVSYAVSEDDISASTWTETALKSVDTKKPRLPPPRKKK